MSLIHLDHPGKLHPPRETWWLWSTGAVKFALSGGFAVGQLQGQPLKAHAMMKNHRTGETLREDPVPLGIEVTDAAQRLGMSRTRISRVINGHAAISPDLAIRFERAGLVLHVCG